MRGLRVVSYLTAFLSAVVAPSCFDAQTQAAVKCTRPSGAPYTLPDVMELIDDPNPKLTEARKLLLIDSCHVSFPMDSSLIERLASDLHATPAIMDSLNKATVAQLSVEQAHAQVGELERHLGQIDAAVNKDRDAALAKLDADYPAQRERAGHVEPKGQFETTAAYNQRVQQSQAALAAMDAKHQADRIRVTSEFAAKSSAQQEPVQKRIAFLQHASYPDLRPATFGSYNANTGRLTVTLGGEEYFFEKVPPAQAEALSKSWQKVKLAQPFNEEDLHTRSLVLESDSVSVVGYSRHARDEAAFAAKLAQAQALLDGKDYGGAITAYNAALAIRPDSPPAKDGLAASQAGQNKQEAQNTAIGAAGEWIDPMTRLMWSVYDNREDVNWKAANSFCKDSRRGDHTDWRVPTLEELKPLYDPRSNRNTTPLKKARYYEDNGALKNDAPGSYWPYHIRETLLLTGTGVWSATKDTSKGYHDMTYFFFYGTGAALSVPDGFKRNMRALCVRDNVP